MLFYFNLFYINDVHEDKRTRLEGDPRNSKYWHRRFPGEEKSGSEASAENLGELCYRNI